MDCGQLPVVKKLKTEYFQAALAEKNQLEMDVIVLESIDSTNTWALQQCKTGKTIPFACFAEQQTQGKGRRGKHWYMLPDCNVAMTLLWSFDLSQQQINLLPLSIALAIVKTLEDIGLKEVQVKWPNDIYVDGKKISGVLVETQPIRSASVDTRSNGKNLAAVAIGVGLNYDMTSRMSSADMPPAKIEELNIKLVLTDVCAEFAGQIKAAPPSRQLVAANLLQNITDVCQNFPTDSPQFLKKFRAHYDFCKNKEVEILLDNNETLSGVALGINDAAELEVLIDGEKLVFNSAEVSVKASS